MVSRGRHPKKEVADALDRARDAGLIVTEIHRGHRWGEARCAPCGLSHDVWCTPRNPGSHAKQLDDFTRSHTHVTS
jgi:hypothetical protein